MLLSREELVSALFCETDRAQRMKTPLSVIQIGIMEGADRQSQSDEEFDHAAGEIVKRIAQLLRTYDSIGKLTRDTFLLILPGCDSSHAIALAQRLKDGISSSRAGGEGTGLRTGACLGVVSSGGRSPFIVMRDAASAFHNARMAGPGAIECSFTNQNADPVAPLNALIHETLSK